MDEAFRDELSEVRRFASAIRNLLEVAAEVMKKDQIDSCAGWPS
jgi:hypothetical protein